MNDIAIVTFQDGKDVVAAVAITVDPTKREWAPEDIDRLTLLAATEVARDWNELMDDDIKSGHVARNEPDQIIRCYNVTHFITKVVTA